MGSDYYIRKALGTKYVPSKPVTTTAATTTTTVGATADCHDNEKSCVSWARRRYCTRYEFVMKVNCPLSCGYCKAITVATATTTAATTTTARSTTKTRPTRPTTTIRAGCKDKDSRCISWSRQKYCEDRKYYYVMKRNCAKSCGFCVAGKTTRRTTTKKVAKKSTTREPVVVVKTTTTKATTKSTTTREPTTTEKTTTIRKATTTRKPTTTTTKKPTTTRKPTTTTKKPTTTRKPTTTKKPTTKSETTTTRCMNKHSACTYWARHGYCDHKKYIYSMRVNCKRSCGYCK